MGLSGLIRYLAIEPVPLSLREKCLSAVACLLAIAAVSYLSHTAVGLTDYPMLVASMGASAVLLFALPTSPLAQPWPFVAGQLLSAVIGVSCALFIADLTSAAALAVAGSVMGMQLTRSLHPPGAATALAPVVSGSSIDSVGYQFVLFPVAINVVLMIVFAIAINRLLVRRRYPVLPATRHHSASSTGQSEASERITGVTEEDIKSALDGFGTYLDVSREDLSQIISLTEMQALRRKMGEITCADVMTPDPLTVEYGTEVEDAWALLIRHRIKAIPVIDRSRRVIGMLTQYDFLKHADLTTYESAGEKLVRFIRRTAGVTADKPEYVGHMMSSPATVIEQQQHVTALVPLMSKHPGHRRIPVVNAEKRLVGIVSQADLIAALSSKHQVAGATLEGTVS